MGSRFMLLFSSFFALFVIQGFASDSRFFPEIGQHYPIFVYEKSVNPQNIMIAFVKLDSQDCKFQPDPRNKAAPLYDFYWLMNRNKFKPVHATIKKNIYKSLEFLSQSDDRHKFTLRLRSLPEFNPNLNGRKFNVESRKTATGCEVMGSLEDLRLVKVFTQSKGSVWPPFFKIRSITLEGYDQSKKVERVYSVQ
jgi:hypothetical protein